MKDAKTASGQKIRMTRKRKGWTWADVAERLGHAPVWTCAVCLGQMGTRPETAEKAGLLFDLTEAPHRGSLPTAVRTNPLIHRFYEAVQVYGTTWREMIDEEFGSGIMSAIDFDVILERQPDQKGDGVRIGSSGKFLPYKRHRSPRGPGVCVGPAARPL